MSKEYSCSSSTCRQKKNPVVSSPICYYGQRSVIRTVKTMKNRGKQFWGYSKYKNSVEDAGCNFFKWCRDVRSDESDQIVSLLAVWSCLSCGQ